MGLIETDTRGESGLLSRMTIIGVLLLLLSTAAYGQYEMVWGSTTGTSGQSSGGQYALIGSVGTAGAVDVYTGAGAPTPDPAQWATVPYATSSSSITMMAAAAQDPNGAVQYYFQNVTVGNGSHDSGWQIAQSYTDTGLTAGTAYEYRVKTRGGGGLGNETSYSAQVSATTNPPYTAGTPEGSAEPVSGELGNDLNLQIDPFTGSVGYTMPISLPPGRQGSEPSLALRYGGGGNGWCGVGWSLGLGAIQRDTRKGVPVARDPNGQYANYYDDDKGFVVAFGAVNSRLVEVAAGEYRAETDQAFLRYEFDQTNNQWIVTDKSGNKFFFGETAGEGQGETAGATMVHPQFDSATGSDNTFLWGLAKIQDINGNLTYVYYTEDANQVYLDEVRYNGHTEGPLTTSSVKFALNNPNDPNDDRPDKSISYATGYRVENNRRLNDISVWVSDHDQSNWSRVRRYHLDYDRSPSTLRSLLTSITMYGTSDVNSLPPVTFDYQQKPFEFERDEDGDPVLRDWGPLDTWGQITRVEHYDDAHKTRTEATFMDINNDGLPDRVFRDDGYTYDPNADPPGNFFYVQLNTGSGFGSEVLKWGPVDSQDSTSSAMNQIDNTTYANDWWEPIPPMGWLVCTASPSRTALMDINGDGFIDRVMRRPGSAPSSYSPASALNYLDVQYGTGLGFERMNANTGGGTDYVTSQWGPLDAQDFDDSWNEGWFTWNSLTCSWEHDSYGVNRLTMMDINGDGLADRVMQKINGASFWTHSFLPADSNNTFLVQLNTGTGFERTDPCSGGGADFVSIDWGPIDAHGRTGSNDDDYAWNAVTATHNGSTFVTMIDINGDGLVDRVTREVTESHSGDPTKYDVFLVQFNTGYGFERAQVLRGGGTDWITRDWGPLNSQGSTEEEWGRPEATTSSMIDDDNHQRTDIALFDINADGLPDRVMRNSSAPYNVLKIELNTGTGFTHQIDGNDIEWLGVSCQGEDSVWWGSPIYSITDYDNDKADSTIASVTMADINGDGLLDRVMRDRTSWENGDAFKVQLNQGPFPDLLCKVNGSLGGTAQVAYTPSTQYDNTDHNGVSRLAFPVQTASSLTVDDGLRHESTTTYEYERGFYDAPEREFRGFGKVTVTDPSGAMSITYFHQGGGYEDPNAGEFNDANSVAKKGMPYRVEVYGNDGKMYTVTVNKIQEAQIDPNGWNFAYVSQTTKLECAGVSYEPGDPNYPTDYRAKVRQSVYDIAGKTGNILKSIDIGEVNLGATASAIAANIAAHTYTSNVTTDDDLYIHTSYATFTNTEIQNKIATTKTTSDLAGSNKLKEIVFTYDTKGRVTSEKTWLDRDATGDVNDYTPTSTYAYDSYGNRNQSIDKAGIQTDTTYDSEYHMYPIEKDTEGFVTSTDFEIRSGLPVRTVDPAGMVAESVYDEFFRLTDAFASTEPNGTADLWLTHIDYSIGGIDAGGITHNFVHQEHQGYEGFTYSDGLGRIVQTRTLAEPNTPGTCRVTSSIYDERGNISFQTLPFFADGNDYTPPYYYKVYLGTSSTLGENDLYGTTSGTEFEPNELDPNTTYYWCVDKYGANDEVLEEGDVWEFSTEGGAESQWRDPENPYSTQGGLEYACYNDEWPLWQKLPNFSAMYPCETGTATTISASVCTETTTFGLEFTGYINITTGGTYTFYTDSDDGSRLYIGNTRVVNNDGLKLLSSEEKSGTIDLKAGKHAITVEYFKGLAGSGITAKYKGPDTSGSKIAIPSNVLYRDNPSAAVVPDPYHQEDDVSVDLTLSWEGLYADTDWDDAQAGVLTEYDQLNRVWRVTPAGGETDSPTGPSTTQYYDGVDPWAQVSTDAEGKVTKSYFDAAGRLIELVDVISGGTDVVMEYEYDRLGRLITTTDADDNEFEAQYDSLGRKIRSIDPDMGTWTYDYDNAGRLIEQVDARGNKVQFTYDQDVLGRITQKTVKNSSNVTVETVTYTYDTSDDPEYLVHKGQLYKVTDGEGWTKTGYDQRGRAIKSTRYISETDKAYTTHTSYDIAGRVTQVTYPDNKAVIAYSYDEVNHLVKVESLWGTGADEVFYQASGFNEIHQETQIDYGNDRQTIYDYYDRTRRLRSMTTLDIHDVNDVIQDISYTYDMASNITSVTDGVYSSPESCGLSNIQYDDLHRLVSLYSAGESTTYTYEYDALGNVHKNGEMGTGSYTYSATQPHAVVSANGNSYAYDACGNMTTRNSSTYGNQTLTYDEQNRLVQVAISGGNTIQFGYSGGGARLWKKVNGQVTGLWIGSLYEEKNGEILCHVYAGDRLVVTFEPVGTFACIIQNNRYLAAIYNNGRRALIATFGHGRAPLSGMGIAILAGIGCALIYSRKRLWIIHGLTSPSSPRLFARQVLLMSLVGSILLAGIPAPAFAGTPVYDDPIFYYYHPDHLGSAQIMTDADGDIVQHYGYQPYGAERDGVSNAYAFNVSSRYTGQTRDDETGLYYYGARYYDPEIARFIQADTTIPDPEFSQAYNRYAYVYNNPLKFTDPTGQMPWWVLGANAESAIRSAGQSAIQGIKTLTNGNVRGFAIHATQMIASIMCTQVGTAIGGSIGQAIGGAMEAAIGAAIGGGNVFAGVAQSLGMSAANWACAKYNGGPISFVGDPTLEEEHLIEFRKSEGNPGTSTPLITASVYGMDKPFLEVYRPDVAPSVNWTEMWGEFKENIHTILDIGGMIEIPGTPIGIGAVFDAIHVGVYIAEGRLGPAAASAACIFGADVVIKGAKFGLKGLRAVRGLEAGAGIYQFTAKSGLEYVGQSRWVTARLKVHRWTGKLPRGGDALILEMPGSTRLQRRIMEQTRINDLGGVDALDNVINSIKEADWSKHGIKPPH